MAPVRRYPFCQIIVTALAVTAGFFPASGGESFYCNCVGVTDGDTISVMRDGQEVKVRLEGIDCPESGQDFSNAAKKYISTLVYGKTVEVRQTGTDRYGRTLAMVYADGTNVNLTLIQAGMAWHFKKYSSDPQLAAAEQAARDAGIGLWSLPTPIAPWDWRSGQGVPVARSSYVFHSPSCRYYCRKNCVIEFKTREEAIAAGYRPGG